MQDQHVVHHNGREVHVGRHYAESADPLYLYGRVRKLIGIEDGKAHIIETWSMQWKSVKLSTFLDRTARELHPSEPVKPYAHVLTHGDRSVWHVFKQSFPMQYWYSLHGAAIYAEPPAATGDDQDWQFDVRGLPLQYRAGLEIECFARVSGIGGAPGGLSPLDASRRESAAHIAAIGRALADGYDILGEQRRLNEARARAAAEYRLRDLDEEIPF